MSDRGSRIDTDIRHTTGRRVSRESVTVVGKEDGMYQAEEQVSSFTAIDISESNPRSAFRHSGDPSGPSVRPRCNEP